MLNLSHRFWILEKVAVEVCCPFINAVIFLNTLYFFLLYKILLLDNSTSMNLMTRLHIEHDMEHVYKTVNRGIFLLFKIIQPSSQHTCDKFFILLIKCIYFLLRCYSLVIINKIVFYVFYICLDMHEQRLKQLRQKLKTLEEDDWRYQPVDKLIGLQ